MEKFLDKVAGTIAKACARNATRQEVVAEATDELMILARQFDPSAEPESLAVLRS